MLGHSDEGIRFLRGLGFDSAGGGVTVAICHLGLCGLILAFVVGLERTRQFVGELDQFWGSRFHGKGVFFCVEVFEGHRIPDKDVGKLACETSSGRNSLSLDALTDLELESTRSLALAAFGDVHRDCLRGFGMTRLESLTSRG